MFAFDTRAMGYFVHVILGVCALRNALGFVRKQRKWVNINQRYREGGSIPKIFPAAPIVFTALKLCPLKVGKVGSLFAFVRD